MTRNEIARNLSRLTDKQLVEVFYSALDGKGRSEKFGEGHFVLGWATRDQDDDGRWEPWEIELLATPDPSTS